MTDFSHWDFAEEFTAREAAALIRGLDPDSPSVFIAETDPVLSRLRSAYFGALYEVETLHDAAADLDTAQDRARWLDDLEPSLLHSITMRETDNLIFSQWIARKWGHDLDAQRFSRQELARWLRATGLIEKSSYSFDASGAPSEPRTSAANPDELPLGRGCGQSIAETIFERIQRQAKEKFFAPARTRDPKKDEVTGWIKEQLRAEGRVESDNIANTMFSIIKPDDHNPKRARKQEG